MEALLLRISEESSACGEVVCSVWQGVLLFQLIINYEERLPKYFFFF
jgi:hypothetical protein